MFVIMILTANPKSKCSIACVFVFHKSLLAEILKESHLNIEKKRIDFFSSIKFNKLTAEKNYLRLIDLHIELYSYVGHKISVILAINFYLFLLLYQLDFPVQLVFSSRYKTFVQKKD